MQVTVVDERDAKWEVDSPTYRIFAQVEGGFSSFDVVGGTFEEVLSWARASRDIADFGVGVKVDLGDGGGTGLVWIIPPPSP